jgi:hypothetical protein
MPILRKGITKFPSLTSSNEQALVGAMSSSFLSLLDDDPDGGQKQRENPQNI